MNFDIITILATLFSFNNLLAVFIGTLSGIVVGGIPGLTATMAVALLIPVTFSLSPVTGLILMGGVYCGAMYGGSIPAILLFTPGTPAAAATALDGYPLSRQGHGGLALKVSVVASFIGGIFSALLLLLVAQPLAAVSLKFGPPEYFLLAIMGLAGIVSLAEEDVVKGLLSGFIGLVIAVIGTDIISGQLRYTMGFHDLYEGVSFMPALIGMFSITQMLELTGFDRIVTEKIDIKSIKREKMPKGLGKFIGVGTASGTVVGILPGEGATIAAFIAYNFAKQISKVKEKFGKGNPEGIAAAESGNNGCVGGSLIPLLTLGIPGNSVAAALLGGLMIHGLIPGHELFTYHADITYTFMLSLFLANITFLAIGTFFAPYFSRISLTPNAILIPAVCMFAVVGAYSMNNSVFDIWLMLVFALLGLILSKTGFSTSAVVLGLILGPIAENGFAQALTISDGSGAIFFESPIAWILWVLIIALLAPPFVNMYKRARKKKAEAVSGS